MTETEGDVAAVIKEVGTRVQAVHDAIRNEALEDAIKAVRDATEPILTDRNAYVLSGPAGIVMAAVGAIRALKAVP